MKKKWSITTMFLGAALLLAGCSEGEAGASESESG